jgi:hypothetical protein
MGGPSKEFGSSHLDGFYSKVLTELTKVIAELLPLILVGRRKMCLKIGDGERLISERVWDLQSQPNVIWLFGNYMT